MISVSWWIAAPVGVLAVVGAGTCFRALERTIAYYRERVGG